MSVDDNTWPEIVLTSDSLGGHAGKARLLYGINDWRIQLISGKPIHRERYSLTTIM